MEIWEIMKKISRILLAHVIVNMALLAIVQGLFSATAFAHAGHGHPGVKMRVSGFDPVNYIYNFTCTVPEGVDTRRYYDIDPTPSYYPQNYNLRSYDPNVTWHLDPINFYEEVHTNAMYHVYCEVQNFSAPPGQQNLAAEVHVDLRTTHNVNDPNIYVLSSDGLSARVKCDPPPGTKSYTITWKMRDRQATESLPQFDNQRIINITVPEERADWDVTCTVFDKDKGTSSYWDMPIEFFESGPAYVPTIEGCIPNEPCTWVHSSGIPPNGTLNVHVIPSFADIYINEVYRGTTSQNGDLTIPNIIPGIYNLVARKNGYEELSTLVPIAAGKILSRNYALLAADSSNNASNSSNCFSNIQNIPAKCNGGTISNDAWN